ncbi:hypothetical protein FEJ81_00010 (plasmid) [Natrinema versiforme]|uniref:Replication protein n=1 Tax=Natrinema versiforme TaxID=88724 RepID=A0A4V6MBC2_9EURY|nr:hypothetical protein FEJ81_00010 [Natrinema versiforme]
MSRSAPVSRPSKTNPADTEKGRAGPSSRRSLKTPLTERDGVDLRAEVCETTLEGVDALSWREATWRWRDYIEDKEGTSAIFENSVGDRVRGSDPHRFDPDYCDKQYAKLKDLERGLRDDYGKRLHTAMLTFTASSTDDDGDPLPPVDHLDGLLSSWEAVTRALRREMEGRRYERLAILEPHKSGYIHIHMAVFVDGPVTQETFAPVIEAHLRNCDGAGRDAHDLADDTTVSVNHVGADRSEDTIENLGTYLAEYLGAYGEDPTEAPEHVQKSNAVLWATGKRRWRPSQGAQEYMATNRSDPVLSDWELVAIEDGDGEEYDVSGAGGGVTRLTTCTDVRRGDPPPDG